MKRHSTNTKEVIFTLKPNILATKELCTYSKLKTLFGFFYSKNQNFSCYNSAISDDGMLDPSFSRLVYTNRPS